MKRVLYLIISVSVLSGLLATGCGEDTGINPVPGITREEPLSPLDCIHNLKNSFSLRDIGLYRVSLSPLFTFHFDPDDVGADINGFIIPESWDYATDREATDNMFSDAYSLEFFIDDSPIGFPDPGETTYEVEGIGMDLLVMVDQNNGFNAEGATADIIFEAYDCGGQTYWRIIDWYDGGREGAGTSLGLIKAMYKYGKPD